MSHRFSPATRWAMCLCATSLVAISLGAFAARGDEPDVGVLGPTPTDPATTGAVGIGVPGLSDAVQPGGVLPGALLSSDVPGLGLLWSTQVPGPPHTPPQLDPSGKPVLDAPLPPDAPPAPRNAIEEAKIARARAAIAAARAGGTGQPVAPADDVDTQAARAGGTDRLDAQSVAAQSAVQSAAQSAAKDAKAASSATLSLTPDPAAGLITVPPPRQEAGQSALTDAEKAKLGKGESQ